MRENLAAQKYLCSQYVSQYVYARALHHFKALDPSHRKYNNLKLYICKIVNHFLSLWTLGAPGFVLALLDIYFHEITVHLELTSQRVPSRYLAPQLFVCIL